MKSVLVIGMGRFGRSLAQRMTALGNDVMIVDNDEAVIEELAPSFTDAISGDCTNEAVLRSLGVANFDVCFVAVGKNFQVSLEATALLKELGAKYIVSKTYSDIQEKFLLMAGANEVAYPERYMAEKLAVRHSAEQIFDFIEITPDYGIYQLPAPAPWIGQSIAGARVRHVHNINILAVKHSTQLCTMPGADYIFGQGDQIIVLGQEEDILRLTKLK